jgi:steroid 5-alpha reductase family enzyme
LLLLFVSGIPLLEKSAEVKHGKNPEYQAYKGRTSIFVLMPPRREPR